MNRSVSVWAAVIKCHRLGGLNNRHLFLTVLEAGRSWNEVLWDSFLVRSSSWLADSHFLAVWEREERGSCEAACCPCAGADLSWGLPLCGSSEPKNLPEDASYCSHIGDQGFSSWIWGRYRQSSMLPLIPPQAFLCSVRHRLCSAGWPWTSTVRRVCVEQRREPRIIHPLCCFSRPQEPSSVHYKLFRRKNSSGIKISCYILQTFISVFMIERC